MKNLIICGYLSGLGLIACTDRTDIPCEAEGRATIIRLPASSVPWVKKSQVFFFRQLEKGDTLVCRMEIEGPKEDFSTYSFELPAGYYRMIFIGNGDMKHIRFEGIPSAENGIIDYSDGTQPPDLYFTWKYVQAGETKRIGAGIVILSSRIALTVRNIPSGIGRVKVYLRNTIAGVSMVLENLPQAAQPSISTEITVTPGSSPVIHLKSLASYPQGGKSFLEVYGYDLQGNPLYRGQSEPFSLGGSEDIKISCGFGSTVQKANAFLPDSTEPGDLDFWLIKEE